MSPTTAGTIKHRHQSTLPAGTSDIDVPEWNDSEVIAGGTTGQYLTRDTAQTDGWGWADLPANLATTPLPIADGGTGVTTGLTVLNATNLTSGTVAEARLPTTVALKPVPIADGGTGVSTGLTVLNADNLASGTVALARLPATVATKPIPIADGGTGVTTGLTVLNATNLTSGTVPDARFPAILPAVSGLNLTNLNAANLASGTLPIARFPADLPLTTSLAIGTNPATTGAIRLANNQTIAARNAANTADINLLQLYTDNFLYIGSNTSGLILRSAAPISFENRLDPVTDNALDIGAASFRWRNIFVSSSVVNKVKAGTPVDADVTGPADGMMVLDSTANKIWVRLGGAWKGVVVA
jgi:hypothetical protein